MTDAVCDSELEVFVIKGIVEITSQIRKWV